MFNNHNVNISPKATIGKNVRIGDNSIIFDNVVIEDNVTIAHNCVIGEPLNDYYTSTEYSNPVTNIGTNCLIRSHSIIYAGNTLGDSVSTGHRVTLREYNRIGHHCVIGTLSDIQGFVTIGQYSRLYSNVHLAQYSKIGDFVFIYPYVVMTNDLFPPSSEWKGGSIGNYTQVAAHSIILSGVTVGENCLLSVNSVVKNNLPDYSLAMGDPAKQVLDIRKFVVLGKGKMYPWMYRFSKGMPWENIGYDEWMMGQRKLEK
jgi:acetyltransferase-like isoleucine patch superfamily enzyme